MKIKRCHVYLCSCLLMIKCFITSLISACVNKVLFLLLLQDFKPVAYPKNQYGKFYTGDSYIVLVVSINIIIKNRKYVLTTVNYFLDQG